MNSRRGAVLIIVLWLITIFMTLLAAITWKVINNARMTVTIQQNAQAYLMMESARLLIAKLEPTDPFAAGDGGTDGLPLGIADREMAGRLGWFRVTNAGAGGFAVTAVGGGSAYRDATHRWDKTTDLNAGDILKNTNEVRLVYNVTLVKDGSGTVTQAISSRVP